MMEAVRTSETSVYSKETTRCYIPEDSNLYARRREKRNLTCNTENLNGITLWETFEQTE
jgi:hypothetical protein